MPSDSSIFPPRGRHADVLFERAAAHRPVTAEDRERTIQALIDQYGHNLAVEVSDVPDVMPLWSGFFVDAE